MLRVQRVWARARGVFYTSTSTAAYAQDLFKELRQLTLIPRPCDAQHLARLALAGAELTRDGQLNKKQQALLAYRLEMLGWYSREFCEATGQHADSYVDELLPAEWLILLRYFTSCGHVHPIFCEAVSRWLLNEKFGKLQLKQLEEVLNSLGYAGYLTTELGDEICNALKHLPTEAEEQVLVQLASTLAAADAGDSDFYRRVLAAVTAPKTEGPKLGMSEESAEDYWRLSLLFFLAKADVIRWSLLLNILRRLNPRVAESTPYSLIPQLFQHLQSNSLENDVLLLEARPFAMELQRQLLTGQSLTKLEPRNLAKTCSSMGYLAVIDSVTSEAICNELDQKLAEATDMESMRYRLEAGWAAFVARSQEQSEVNPGPRLTPLVELREMEKYMEQQLRQVMLSHKALTDPQHTEETPGLPARAFFTAQRQKDQLRIFSSFTARLRSLGAYCRDIPSSEAVSYRFKGAEAAKPAKKWGGRRSAKSSRQTSSMAAKDTFVLVYTHKENSQNEIQKIVMRVTVWVKHPLLLAADGDIPQGAQFDGCCLNGFEAIEWWLTKMRPHRTAFEHVLLLIRSDSKSRDAALAAERFAQRLGIPIKKATTVTTTSSTSARTPRARRRPKSGSAI